MTRDSWLLPLGVAGAIVGYLLTMPPPTVWGYIDYLHGAAFLIGLAAAQAGNSWLKGKADPGKVDITKVTIPLVVAALALSSMGASCHHGTPRHDSTVNLGVLTTSLGTLQTSEKALYGAGTVPQLTPLRHQTFNAKMVTVWDAMDKAVIVVQVWRPGQPIPPQLAALVDAVSDTLKSAADVIGVALPKDVADVWDAVVKILVVVGGSIS
jgi:hypothetical protein